MFVPGVCIPKALPHAMLIESAQRAWAINPLNKPAVQAIGQSVGGQRVTRESIALVTTKYWQHDAQFTVAFLDGPDPELRAKILSHLNAWGLSANVSFTESNTDPEVRIARTSGEGYWSYVGTDLLSIDSSQPTMNLDSFSLDTPDSEFHRVVRHEAGHTLGFPHEHMRKDLVDRIDPDKAIEYFGQTQGWTPDQVRAQVLTPLDEEALIHTEADQNSIMCYQIPGEITRDGEPILGGIDIDEVDYAFAAHVYPMR